MTATIDRRPLTGPGTGDPAATASRIGWSEFVGLSVLALYLAVKFGPVELFARPPGFVSSAGIPALAVVALVVSPRGAIGRVPVSLPLVSVLCWSAISVAWSRDQVFTQFLIRSEFPALLLVLAVLGTLDARTITRGLLWFFYGVLAFSLATSLTLTESQRSPASSEVDFGELIGWRGGFGHKNGLGMFMVLVLATVLAFERRRFVRPVAVLVTVAAVVGSRSATAASGLLVATVVWVWLAWLSKERSRRDRSIFALVSVAVTAMAVFVALGLLPSFLDLYGKDLTFSGRTIIWQASLDEIVNQPFHGLGYGGVWFDLQEPVTASLHRAIGFRAAHAHNGAIELLLEVGLVGLTLYVVFLGTVLRRAFGLVATRSGNAAGRWAITTSAAIVTMSLSEVLFQGAMLGYLAIVWVVLARTEQGLDAADREPAR